MKNAKLWVNTVKVTILYQVARVGWKTHEDSALYPPRLLHSPFSLPDDVRVITFLAFFSFEGYLLAILLFSFNVGCFPNLCIVLAPGPCSPSLCPSSV